MLSGYSKPVALVYVGSGEVGKTTRAKGKPACRFLASAEIGETRRWRVFFKYRHCYDSEEICYRADNLQELCVAVGAQASRQIWRAFMRAFAKGGW